MKKLINIGGLICPAETTARDVLKRINSATPHLFQLIVDGTGRLIGTVTDGDIRRALVQGSSLDEPARACMHAKPITGRIGDDAENARQLLALGAVRAFLPILDSRGVPRQVLIKAESDVVLPPALVMAGGRGTRLGPRTQRTPKPLLKVARKPILEHVLSGLESAGVSEIYVSAHYLADQIIEFVGRRRNRATVRIVSEKKPMGTAGALAGLPNNHVGPIMVVNGDVITRANYAAMVTLHNRHGHDGTIAVARYDLDIPFGIINYGPDGRFSGIQEKPRLTYFIAAGIYYLSPEFIALVPKDRPMDMPELLNLGRTIGLYIAPFPIHEYWIDVGRPTDLRTAERDHQIPKK